MLISRKIAPGLIVLLIFTMASCRSSKNSTKSSKKAETYQFYSQKLGFPVDEKNNEKLIKSVVKWLGTPYKFSGCDNSGIDCSCLVKNIYSEVYNIELKRNSIDIYDACNTISKSHLSEGDLIFFKTEGNKISHIGIYIKDTKFVHSSTKKGVMISDLTEPYFEKTYYKSGRIKK